MPTKRLILCRGAFCNLDRRADKLCRAIEPLVNNMNGDSHPPKIQIATANCLSMCGAGPNAILHPDGRRFNHLTIDALKHLIETDLWDNL